MNLVDLLKAPEGRKPLFFSLVAVFMFVLLGLTAGWWTAGGTGRLIIAAVVSSFVANAVANLILRRF